MAEQYRVKGPCKVAGVEPGGTVTREQVEAWGGDDAHINFDALVGKHLEKAGEDKAATSKASPAKKAAQDAG